MRFLSIVANFLLDLLFPKLCLGCGEEGDFVCDRCFSTLKTTTEMLNFPGIEKVFICCEHSELLRKMIHQLKYGFTEELAGKLGFFLKKRLQEMLREMPAVYEFPRNCIADCAIVPVPLHWRRFNERGFNQSALLAKELTRELVSEFSRELKLPMINILKRTRYTKPQAELGRDDRLRNVVGAFEIQKNMRVPSRVILIDDVCTTGSTLIECAQALKKNGVEKIYAFTLSHGI